jgi:hypothetical protein
VRGTKLHEAGTDGRFSIFFHVQNLPKIWTHEIDSGSEIFYRVGLTLPIQRDYDEAGSDLHHSYECGMKI